MNELGDNTVPTINLAIKRRRRKGGTILNTSKQRKRRDIKKKDLTCIEGRGIASDFSK